MVLILVLVFTSATVHAQDVNITATPLDEHGEVCTGQFNAVDLDHVTTVPGGDDVRQFEANGGGVALGDLDDDGDLDMVLANHADPNTILWNEGDLTFRTERMAHGDSRAVTIVDVDADGLLDIVFTRTSSAPNYWHNEGDQTFVQEFLPNVSKPLYSINWGDLDADGDLDMVGATYDAGLLSEFGQDFLASGDAGVYYYENTGDGFAVTRLEDEAQALALALVDVNGDNRLDILVGNDFAVPDYTFLRTENGWLQELAFDAVTHSTMSFDAGDINNNGLTELFATDMKPYSEDEETMAAWEPIMSDMMDDPHPEGDPQIMENVLQVIDPEGTFSNESAARGIDATGWSWSSKFGDLDNDGFLDLYAVNGMMEMTTFAHLPDHELVEANQAFRNQGEGEFVPAPEWALDSTRSGRGMSMGDLDGDGDLDIVVNNLRGAAQLFENDLCAGESLLVDLRHPSSGNTHALGATLTLYTDTGTFTRQVRALSGYLSGDPPRVHFGLPDATQIERLEIRWTDGEVTTVESPESLTLLTVERTD